MVRGWVEKSWDLSSTQPSGGWKFGLSLAKDKKKKMNIEKQVEIKLVVGSLEKRCCFAHEGV